MFKNESHASEESHIGCDIYQGIAKNGIVISMITSLIILSLITYYLLLDKNVTSFSYGLMSVGYGNIISAYALFHMGRNSKWIDNLWLISTIFISLSFVTSAAIVTMTWGAFASAEKILIFGLILILMTWYIDVKTMALSTAPLSVMYVYVFMICPNTNLVETTIDIMKFPIIFLASMVTVRKFFQLSEDRFKEKLQAIRELERISSVDELTTISNRKGFNTGLANAVDISKRFKLPLTLVIADIDYFKQYNDALGHPAGDVCLQEVASIIRSQCRRSIDVVARIGGEEFAFILSGTTSEQAVLMVEKIVESLELAGIEHPDSEVSDKITLSMGVCQYKNGSPTEFYNQADKAMYQAKLSGRNQYAVYDHS